jgi:hypothetical protein
VDLMMPKLVFLGMNFLGFCMGIYKCANMGLLPIASSNWATLLSVRTVRKRVRVMRAVSCVPCLRCLMCVQARGGASRVCRQALRSQRGECANCKTDRTAPSLCIADRWTR